MTDGKTLRSEVGKTQEYLLLDARLTPHRSLSRRGFCLLMLTFGGISFVAGAIFVAVGAWPVMGFLGLDVLLLWVALKTNFGAAKVSEQITVTANEVTIRCFVRDRQTTKQVLNPRWIQIETKVDEDDGMLSLGLRSHGKSHIIGAFLDPGSRESFAQALRAALSSAHRGVY